MFGVLLVETCKRVDEQNGGVVCVCVCGGGCFCCFCGGVTDNSNLFYSINGGSLNNGVIFTTLLMDVTIYIS